MWEVWLSPARLTTVAAALTLVLAAIWWLKPKVEPQMVAAPPAIEIEEDFTPEMAEEYIKANMLDFDTEMLFSNLEEEEQPEQPDNTTKTREKSKKELDNLLNDLTEEELEELL